SKKKEGHKKWKLGRNPRIPFTQHQLVVLEEKFRRTHYLSSMDVAELSSALNLTETR
ncbi:homeobox protein MSH-D, partial [Biomphalaria pfeifferi]